MDGCGNIGVLQLDEALGAAFLFVIALTTLLPLILLEAFHGRYGARLPAG